MKSVKFESKGNIGLLTLGRPDEKNSINYQMKEELGCMVGQIRTNKSIQSLIVTGNDRASCCGAALKAVLGESSPGGGVRRITAEDPLGLINFSTLDIPVVTAINGSAVGGGVGI